MHTEVFVHINCILLPLIQCLFSTTLDGSVSWMKQTLERNHKGLCRGLGVQCSVCSATTMSQSGGAAASCVAVADCRQLITNFSTPWMAFLFAPNHSKEHIDASLLADMSCHGMAWHGMAWHGMAWHGKIKAECHNHMSYAYVVRVSCLIRPNPALVISWSWLPIVYRGCHS